MNTKIFAYLARISHQFPTAAVDKPMSTASRSKKVLNIASAMPPRFFLRVPCSHGLLRRLVTEIGEKCGLAFAIALASCSGGSGASPGSGASFQDGLPPADVSGCYTATATVTENTCASLNLRPTINFCLSQQGSAVTYHTVYSTPSSTRGASASTGTISQSSTSSPTGVVSGNSFKFEISTSYSEEGCTIAIESSVVGTVTEGKITGSQEGKMTAGGDCPESGTKECVSSLTFSGDKTGPYTASPSPAAQTVQKSPSAGGPDSEDEAEDIGDNARMVPFFGIDL